VRSFRYLPAKLGLCFLVVTFFTEQLTLLQLVVQFGFGNPGDLFSDNKISSLTPLFVIELQVLCRVALGTFASEDLLCFLNPIAISLRHVDPHLLVVGHLLRISCFVLLLVPPVRVELTIHRLKGECDAASPRRRSYQTPPGFRLVLMIFFPWAVVESNHASRDDQCFTGTVASQDPALKRRRPPRNLFRAAFASSNNFP
jgi:hypothetical protein